MKAISLLITVLIQASLAASLSAAPEQTEKPAAILARSVEAIGGEAAIARLASQHRKGAGHVKDENEGFKVETYLLLPDKFMLTLEESSGAESCTHVANGSVGWVRESRSHTINPEIIEDLSYCLNPHLLVYLRDHADSLRYQGRTTLGAEEVYILEKTLADGRVRRFCFGVQSGLLLQAGRAFIEDYRTLDGVRLPFRLRPFNGAIIVEFQQVENGAAVDAQRFEIPPAVLEKMQTTGVPKQPAQEAAFKIDW